MEFLEPGQGNTYDKMQVGGDYGKTPQEIYNMAREFYCLPGGMVMVEPNWLFFNRVPNKEEIIVFLKLKQAFEVRNKKEYE